MPSQDDYMDDLLKNMENNLADTDDMEDASADTNDIEDDSADIDNLIENAASDMETAHEGELGFELDAEPEDEILTELGRESKEVLTSDRNAEELDDLDDLDLDEIYSDIGLYSDDTGKEGAAPNTDSVERESAPDLEALSSMSEDEIERLLSAGNEEESASDDKDILYDDEELLNMLNDTEDDDLQDIHEMLHKADNNEAADDSLLQRNYGSEDESGKLPGGEDDLQNPLSEKEQKALQKKLRKQERAAAKAAAKAEKIAAKAAAKAEKAAAKAAAKTGSAAAGEVSEETPNEKTAAKDERNGSRNTLFDTSLLDSIVAGSEQAGAAAAPKESGNGSFGEDTREAEAQDENISDELDIDMDSLFGDSEDADQLSRNPQKSNDSAASNTGKVDAAISEQEETETKKGGFISKIVDFLTEDEDDEESESLQLSDENRDILDDLDNEKASDKKKKGASNSGKSGKGKDKAKAKKSKAKKPNPPKKPKKAKKPKPEKPKKEKEPEPEPLIPERKLTLKRVMPIVLVCVSFGVFIIVLINSSIDFTDKQAAAEAYNAGDYQTCYQNLYGKNLNETEQIMFGKSESILYIRLWLREYEMFAQDGAEVEALDSLIQTVSDYPKLYDYAVQWDAGAEVAAGYQTILNILLEKYGLTEEQAKEIASESSDRRYTRMIVEIVYGNGFSSGSGQTSTSESEQQTDAPEPDQDTLQDVLPEEEGLGEGEFIGN